MTMSGPLHMPALDGAAGWLNSPPLSPAELRGRPAVVNFWTLTCINWLRQEPYVRAWSRAYRDDGLVVIGVHTPEFFFEHDIDLVRQATTGPGDRLPGRDRQPLRDLERLRQPLLAGAVLHRLRRRHRRPAVRRGRVRAVRARHPAAARRRPRARRRRGDGRRGGGRLGSPALARDVPGRRAQRGLRLTRRRGRGEPALPDPREPAPQPVGRGRPLDHRAGEGHPRPRGRGASPTASRRATRIW